MKHPRVSIITALHNKGAYVAETVRSVLAQTMTDWELIVVENGSTDNGPEVVRQFSDPRIRLVVSPKQGPGAARNFGLGVAGGEWILFLDADDLIAPAYLENILHQARESNADLVVSRWRKFTDVATENFSEEHPACEGRTHVQLLDSAIAFTPWIIHAAIFKKSILKPYLFWPEDMDRYLGEDTVFWFRLLCDNPNWICSRAVGALYRWKSPGCRTENEDSVKWFEGLHNGATRNVQFLAEKNLKPTPAQAENLMRLYEGLYQLATQNEKRDIALKSLALARHWLGCCSPSRPSLVARQFLGIRLFNSLKLCMPFPN